MKWWQGGWHDEITSRISERKTWGDLLGEMSHIKIIQILIDWIIDYFFASPIIYDWCHPPLNPITCHILRCWALPCITLINQHKSTIWEYYKTIYNHLSSYLPHDFLMPLATYHSRYSNTMPGRPGMVRLWRICKPVLQRTASHHGWQENPIGKLIYNW